MVEEGGFQATFVSHLPGDMREGGIPAFVLREQGVQRAGAIPFRDWLAGHQARPERAVGDLMGEGLPDRAAPDVEFPIELRIAEATAQGQELGCGLVIVLQKAVEEVHEPYSVW